MPRKPQVFYRTSIVMGRAVGSGTLEDQNNCLLISKALTWEDYRSYHTLRQGMIGDPLALSTRNRPTRWHPTTRGPASEIEVIFDYRGGHAARAWLDRQGFQIRGRTVLITQTSERPSPLHTILPVSYPRGSGARYAQTSAGNGQLGDRSLGLPERTRWSCRACARAPGVLLCLDRTCPCRWVAISPVKGTQRVVSSS